MMKTIIQRFAQVSQNFKTSSYIQNKNFILNVNEISFEFPINIKAKNTNLGYMQPREWLMNEHKNNTVHEPGLVKILFILAEIFKNQEVRFIDIGALYGYFSVLASKIFKNVEVLSVEANPYSCEYINNIITKDKIKTHQIINTFVASEDTKNRITYICGYKFLSKIEYFIVMFKNLIKYLINLHKKKYDIFKPEKIFLRNSSLISLMKKNKNQIDVLKIDTEGYQALFLPSSTQYLIKNNVIILLEFDDVNTLKKYNSNNKKLCEPFLKQGYKLYWLNHRANTNKLEEKISVDVSMEINSLGLLIPSQYI